MSETPMMKQYHSIKEKHQDSILMFRLGDFYEMFFDDAKVAAKALDLTLTSRNKKQENSVPLCGIPYHSAQGYINKLLEQGHKVAICEQTEDPKKAKGIVKREVVQIYSPALVMDPECLDGASHNFLLSIFKLKDVFGLAMVDISTGTFKLTEFHDETKLIDEVLRLEAKEILLAQGLEKENFVNLINHQSKQIKINPLSGWHYDADYNQEIFEKYFKANVEGLGLENNRAARVAGGAILSYLQENSLLKPDLLSRPQFYFAFDSMIIGEVAKRNLELVKTLHDGGKKGSLLWFLDQANTTMGSRKIKDWLLYPLIEKDKINSRLDGVEELVKHQSWLDQLSGFLSQISDLERIQNRILANQANARDLIALKESFESLKPLKESLNSARSKILSQASEEIDPLEDVLEDIQKTIVEDPPLSLKEGGLICKSVLPELDELKDIERNGKSTIAKMEAIEKEQTGISSLKIRYNKVFGYYIEVTHTHKDKVPKHYIRKQTLTNAERYITDELKKYEDKVLGASERIKDIEYTLFQELRERVGTQSHRIKQTAKSVAVIDALVSLAKIAIEYDYVRPEILEDNSLNIEKGRHPLVEALHQEEAFVPNDIELNPEDCQLMLITGPNMAGKSTVMRQAAIMTLMAHMGSFVPAEKAEIGLTDRIFTRIGASDYLQKGQSTFMVEMLETAAILSQATSKSLIILDEIGRGTSTFDGLSIAWAVAETIHDQIKARTLFATHYHELTDLALEKDAIDNFHMSVREWNGEVKFLRELKRGGTNRSYGVLVAGMAGLPQSTIKRAKEILKLLEKKDLQFQQEALDQKHQPSLFEFDTKRDAIREKLTDLNVNELTPIQALNLINELKDMLE